MSDPSPPKIPLDRTLTLKVNLTVGVPLRDLLLCAHQERGGGTGRRRRLIRRLDQHIRSGADGTLMPKIEEHIGSMIQAAGMSALMTVLEQELAGDAGDPGTGGAGTGTGQEEARPEGYGPGAALASEEAG